jgi:hypothetical protein
MSSTIVINGKTYFGNSISISNGKVIIDGKESEPGESNGKIINITVTGNVEKLVVDVCDKISISGSVNSIKTVSGDVDVSGNVAGSINTMSGDVDCGQVSGSVSTMSGNIKNKK